MFRKMRRLLIVGSFLSAAQVASCNLDQATLDSLLQSVSQFAGQFSGQLNLHMHVNGAANQHSGGGDSTDSGEESPA